MPSITLRWEEVDNVLRLLPPLTITVDEINDAVARLDAATTPYSGFVDTPTATASFNVMIWFDIFYFTWKSHSNEKSDLQCGPDKEKQF